MRKMWLRPVLTAVLFPVVLVGAIWGFDHFSGEEWLPWTKVAVTSQQAIAIAEAKCFSRAPSYLALKPWHTRLGNDRWAIWANQKGRYFAWPSDTDAFAYAQVDAQTGVLTGCSMGVSD